jgi:uncharacterized membrane-anchored protein
MKCSTDLRVNVLLALACVLAAPAVFAAEDTDAARDEYERKVDALAWIKGPTSVPVGNNAKLTVPEGYVFLDATNTAKFDELNENFSNGKEVMIGPADHGWAAYLEFEDGGYVKDNEKIDADALLKTLQENTEANNEERQKRGWTPLHVKGWAVPPAYNQATKRLEWATTLQSSAGTGVNFFTKVLGRRGHTSVVMATAPSRLGEAESALNTVLDGYTFNAGESYAEWKPGDKVAEYGLAALVLGGAAAIATKKGLWAVIVGFLVKGWKLVAIAVAAVGASLRKLLGKKKE